MTRHPDQALLALYAGGELGFLEKWSTSLHVAACVACREEVELFRSARAEVRRQAAELPPDLNWGRLSGEMKANIRLGLAAGECVARVPARPLGWHPAMVLAAVLMVLLSGWWLHLPAPSAPERASVEGIRLESSSSGISLEEGRGAITLMNAGSNPVLVTVSTAGAVRARYVDEDTGEVTINNVYAQ